MASTEADKQYQRTWYIKNLERNRQVRRERAADWRENNWADRLYFGAKQRAKERGLPFDIEKSDVVIPERCPIFDVPFERKTEYAATLDRFDPTLGYVKGNVWVISRKANVMKNDATKEQLMRFAQWVTKTLTH